MQLETWYSQMVEKRVRARGGRVLEFVGDEALAVFASPRQAIQAAVELQEQFQRVIEGERHFPLALRVGVEAGEAIPYRGKYTGSTVHLASKICSLAGPGEVLTGETLSRLVRKMDGLTFVDRGRSELRGYSDPLQITQVVREDAAAREASTSTGSADTDSEARA